MNRMLRGLLFGASLIMALTACEQDQQTPATVEQEQPARKVPVPSFNQDSAYAYVAAQVAFGPRVPNSEAHRQCRDWLAAKLASFGAKVTLQDFTATAYTGQQLQCTNIIGSFNPEAQKRIVLAAHWDSRFVSDQERDLEKQKLPVPGADDGASGVGVLLELARLLHEHPIDMGVDIIFFDAEDQGEDGGTSAESWCLGAQYWARNPHVSGYRARYGILLDMVGAKGARFAKEGASMSFAPQLVNKIWKLARQMGYGQYFVDATTGGVTDDHFFVSTIARIPMIDIINKPAETDTGFGPHWHTQADDMDVISKRTLKAVGQVVTAVVYRENNGTF